jgi:Tol biopolymer transport system component
MRTEKEKTVTRGMYAIAVALVLAAAVRQASAYTITQLTFEPSYEGDPAWSPDGTKIAFVSDRDGNSEIYVMDANGSNQGRLTNEGGHDIEPDWSPDGRKIVFASGVGDEYNIWVVNADGQQRPPPLTWQTGAERDPAWRYTDKILYHDPYGDGTIWVMNADGSSQTALATGEYPCWSPDGTKIAYASNKHRGNPEIYVMSADGSAEQRLTFAGLIAAEPAWSPDGTRIVFSLNEVDITPDNVTPFPEVYVMDSNGSNLERLTFDDWEYDPFYWGLLRRSPTWFPDGTKIAYHYKGDIWVMSGLGLTADLQHDGIVNLRDFAVIAEYWLGNEPSADIAPEGGDGEVNSLDLAKLAEEWLQTEQ